MDDVMRLVEHIDQRAAGHKTEVLSLNAVGAESLRGFLAQIPGVRASAAPGANRNSPATGASSSPSPSPSAAQSQSPQTWRRSLGDSSRSEASSSQSNARSESNRRRESNNRRGN
jgi:hypothetical protein